MTELTVVAKSSDWEIWAHGQNLTGVQSHSTQPYFFPSDKQILITADLIIHIIIFIALQPPESLCADLKGFIDLPAIYSSHLVCVPFSYEHVACTARSLAEVCAEMVPISKAKQTDTPYSLGFRQTINESTHITAV